MYKKDIPDILGPGFLTHNLEDTDTSNGVLITSHDLLAIGSAQGDIDLTGGGRLAVRGVVGTRDSGDVLQCG